MEKIKEIKDSAGGFVGEMRNKINEIIEAVNNQKCVENEEPIYEILSPNDVLIISENEEGLLVANNHLGTVIMERVPYPKGDSRGQGDKVED